MKAETQPAGRGIAQSPRQAGARTQTGVAIVTRPMASATNNAPNTPASGPRSCGLARPHGSTELLGAGYRGGDGAITCALCHHECEWEECQGFGCEDGYYDCYDDDPNWYDPGDVAACPECRGRGGNWWCATKDCPTKMITRILNGKLSDDR